MEWKRGDGRTAKLLSGHLDFSSPLSRQNNARFQLHRELTRFFQSSSRIKPTVHCPRHDSFVSTACYLLCAVAVKWCFSILSHLPCSSNLPFQFVSIRFERIFFFWTPSNLVVCSFARKWRRFWFRLSISLLNGGYLFDRVWVFDFAVVRPLDSMNIWNTQWFIFLLVSIIFRFAVIRLSQR